MHLAAPYPLPKLRHSMVSVVLVSYRAKALQVSTSLQGPPSANQRIQAEHPGKPL